MTTALGALACALAYAVLIGYRARGRNGTSWQQRLLLAGAGLAGVAAGVLAAYNYFAGPDAATAIKALSVGVLYVGRQSAHRAWRRPAAGHPDEEAAIREARLRLRPPPRR